MSSQSIDYRNYLRTRWLKFHREFSSLIPYQDYTVIEQILDAWGATDRGFYGFGRLTHLLVMLQAARVYIFNYPRFPLRERLALEFALWHLDAKWDPKKNWSTGECVSFALSNADQLGLGTCVKELIGIFILAQDRVTNVHLFEFVARDISRAWLGSSVGVFMQHLAGLRVSHGVSRGVNPAYARREHKRFVALDREVIFITPYFNREFERKAHRNLRMVLAGQFSRFEKA